MLLKQHIDLNIGILGLGATGTSVFNALNHNCSSIICFDDNDVNCANFVQETGDDNIVSIVGLDSEMWTQLDKIIVSPGIPLDHRIFKIAAENEIQISSDIELFIQNNPDSEFIFITGTNGKSTTTALLGHILIDNGLDFIIGGNIGTPVLDLPQKLHGYVLELSSFQLDLLGSMNPKISILLNISPDHLNRHGTMEEYVRVKKKVLSHNNIKIIGIDDEYCREIYSSTKKLGGSKVIAISNEKSGKDIVACTPADIGEKDVYAMLWDGYFDSMVGTIPKNKSLLGKHNMQNIAAAFSAARLLGLSTEQIFSSAASFDGLPHRMQFVATHGNVNFYNDSKATNSAACIASLRGMENVYLLLGGQFKEESLDLAEAAKNVRKVYIFGQDREKLAGYLSGQVEYVIVETLEQAVKKAYEDAKKGDTKQANILLAPASASFDQFTNFAARGERFIELVNQI